MLLNYFVNSAIAYLAHPDSVPWEKAYPNEVFSDITPLLSMSVDWLTDRAGPMHSTSSWYQLKQGLIKSQTMTGCYGNGTSIDYISISK